MTATSFNNPGKPHVRLALGVIGAYLLVKATATDGAFSQASAAGDKLVGVTGPEGAEDGKSFDLYIDGVCPVTYGGDVAAGDPLRSDADGKAVVAQPGERFCMIAQEAGDAGTIGSGQVAHGFVPLDATALATLFTAAFPPGADGHVLTSTGAAWGSEAPA